MGQGSIPGCKTMICTPSSWALNPRGKSSMWTSRRKTIQCRCLSRCGRARRHCVRSVASAVLATIPGHDRGDTSTRCNTRPCSWLRFPGSTVPEDEQATSLYVFAGLYYLYISTTCTLILLVPGGVYAVVCSGQWWCLCGSSRFWTNGVYAWKTPQNNRFLWKTTVEAVSGPTEAVNDIETPRVE